MVAQGEARMSILIVDILSFTSLALLMALGVLPLVIRDDRHEA
jgi:hypothetical protein